MAGIRSALTEVSETVAASTTSIAPAAADEISAAIARVFGQFGEEFQAISTRTQAFHGQFLRALNSSVAAYLNSETAIVESLLAAAAPAAAGALPAASILDGLTGALNPGGLLGGLGLLTGGLPGLPALPNLNALLPGLIGPAPGPTPVSLAAITGPYERLVSNTINNLQSLGNGLAANPFPFLRQFITNQSNYGHIIATAFSDAGQHLSAGAGAATILADLAPIASIPARIGQNFVNVLSTLTDFSYSVGTNINPLTVGLNQLGTMELGAAFFGFPIALGIDAIGSPITTGSAIVSVASAFGSAIQSGDGFGALVAVLTAPAVVTDGFLNGQVSFGLSLPGVSLPLVGGVGGVTVPLTAQIPLGGILTPLDVTTLVSNPLASPTPLLSVPLGGTPTGGILPGLLLYAPQQLAEAIGAPPILGPLVPLPEVVLPGIGSLPNLAGVVDGLRGVLGGLGGLPDLGGLLGGLGGLPDLGGVLGGLGGLPGLPALPGLPPLLPGLPSLPGLPLLTGGTGTTSLPPLLGGGGILGL
ncbi:hypothetical protein A5636_10775 [Mycobacterium asiaticum]|uniref:PE domain-containing protein n=1 Tax=Mycobacterium asiaticum TaxID=1790 RepID=A0A1A3MRF2_MYCAS|nr:hypothetical protein A5636_10775 [Mycobacterium asiaticum]